MSNDLMSNVDATFEIKKARYAKGMIAVHCESDGSGWKTRAMRLCSALNARWSNRERAYIMSPSKAKRLLDLWRADRDPDLGDCNGKLGFKL